MDLFTLIDFECDRFGKIFKILFFDENLVTIILFDESSLLHFLSAFLVTFKSRNIFQKSSMARNKYYRKPKFGSKEYFVTKLQKFRRNKGRSSESTRKDLLIKKDGIFKFT